MTQEYIPQVGDYVRWTTSMGLVHEGWVYFYDTCYITIEIGVKDKPQCEYTKEEKHKKIHSLLVCRPENWHELEYITNRRDAETSAYDKIPSRY